MFQLRGDKRLLQPGMKAPFDRDRCTEEREWQKDAAEPPLRNTVQFGSSCREAA